MRPNFLVINYVSWTCFSGLMDAALCGFRCEATGLEMATDGVVLSPAMQAPQKRCKDAVALSHLSWKSYFNAKRRVFQ